MRLLWERGLRWQRPIRFAAVALLVVVVGSAAAQEYSIRNPAEAESAPVHLTEPVTGRVEVVNQPAVQDVQVVGGLEQPLEVRGDVGLRLSGPLPVEWINPPPAPTLTLDGPVTVTAAESLRVWVENQVQTPPAAVAPAPRFVAFSFAGVFEAEQIEQRRSFAPPAGMEFQLTDLTLDTRPDAILHVRVMARPESVAGVVTGAGDGELAVLVLDPRTGSSVRPATPVPLSGPFTVQVRSEGPGQGAPFAILAAGVVRGVAPPAP